MEKSDFAVMQQMADENMGIRMTPHFVAANLAKGGGHVTMGVDAGVIYDLMTEKYVCALYILDQEQFFNLKKQPGVMTDFLTKLREGNIQRDAHWSIPGQRPTAAFRACELAGEVGEACNIIKKLERGRLGMKGGVETHPELIEELADIVICVDLIAMHYGINLLDAIRDKWNKTSDKYGFDQKI